MCKTCTTFSARPSLQNDMDGGVAAALSEKEADDDLLTIARAQRDEARRERDVLRQERDEARERLAEAAKEVREQGETIAELAAEQPRPLTPDAITDEMVERARNAPIFDGRLSPTPRLVREMLTAALTEPPRPEGAEELARMIATADVGEWDCGDLADALLATGRVRVVTEEQP